MRGGYKKGAAFKNDKHRVWTEYFTDHLSAADKAAIVVSSVPSGKRHLYVIDMQKDFVDKRYGSEAMGKFAVGDGQAVIQPILEHVNRSLQDNNCKNIIFSRDYHPADHCSFFNGPGNRGGNFPSHCVQGTEGAEMVKEFKLSSRLNVPKVKLIFKGIHADTDSFSAAEFDGARQKSSGGQCKCPSNSNGGCSSVTGGYTIKGNADPFLYNGPVNMNNSNKFELPNVEEGDVIEVCGLAGDYCVRDTAIALKQKYGSKVTVVVLNNMVRYPFLPLVVPILQHRDNENLNKFNTESRGKTQDNHLAHLDRFRIEQKDKGLNYYLFDKDGLVDKDSIPDEQTLKKNLGNYFHFISDPRDIVKDYKKVGVKIMISGQAGGYTRKAKRSRVRSSRHR